MLTRRGSTGSLSIVLLLASVACATSVAAAPDEAPGSPRPAPPAAAPVELKSYDVGLMLAGQLAHNGLVQELSVDALVRGLKDGLAGRAATTAERDEAMQFMRTARDALVERNRAAAREFLDKNAKQPGVKTTPSGLQYRVLAEGDPNGTTPRPMDQVTVRYRATLADGTEFDRSDVHDRPASFRLNTLFKGWQEALLAMKPGATWQLFVPPELSYGVNPPPTIPPGALLIYELELVHVEPAATPLPKPRSAADGKAPAAPSAQH